MIPDADFLGDVASTYELGSVRGCRPVPGGLSNDLFRLETARGAYALKVMRANADASGFRANIERAFAIERTAVADGVPCPRPIELPDATCLADVAGTWVRVHAWVDGEHPVPEMHAHEAGALLAAIQRANELTPLMLADEPWDEARWSNLAMLAGLPLPIARRLGEAASMLAELEAATSGAHVVDHVASHGDLDPKNTLVVNGTLMALDWDAAAVLPVAREAVSVALDWSTGPGVFRGVLRSYVAAGGTEIPAENWVFGGWVSALGGWLVYNVSQRSVSELGQREALSTLDRLEDFAEQFEQYRAALE